MTVDISVLFFNFRCYDITLSFILKLILDKLTSKKACI